jgi:hypothetical protein
MLGHARPSPIRNMAYSLAGRGDLHERPLARQHRDDLSVLRLERCIRLCSVNRARSDRGA